MRKRVNDHGTYRSTHEVLADDADYQDLSPLAQALWHTLKLKLGMCGIAVLYTVVLTEFHRKATAADIEGALQELEAPKANGARGWIVRERNIVWLVNGLRFEPTITLSNPNHMLGVQKAIAVLPKSNIVSEFMAYYGLGGGHTPSHPPTHANGIPMPSTPPLGIRETESREGEREREQRARTESDGDLEHLPAAPAAVEADASATASPAAQDSGTATADPPLPESARRLLRRCYGLRGSGTPTPRQLQVRRDLLATLGPRGAQLEKGVWIRAADADHLDAACRHVLSKQLVKSDAAIQHVLLYLRDTWLEIQTDRARKVFGEAPAPRVSGQQPAPVGALLLRRPDREDFSAASAWLAEQEDDVRAAIDAEVEEGCPTGKAPSFRETLMRQATIGAWKRATSPSLAERVSA